MTVPLRCQTAQQLPLTAAELDQLRGYIAISRVHNTAEFTISPEADAHAQADFVQCRKTNRSLAAEDFHRWLTLARLLAIRSICIQSHIYAIPATLVCSNGWPFFCCSATGRPPCQKLAGRV